MYTMDSHSSSLTLKEDQESNRQIKQSIWSTEDFPDLSDRVRSV